jgi:hypothetical protein
LDNIIAQNNFLATENEIRNQIENQIKALQTLFKQRPKRKVKRIQNKKEVIGSKTYRQDEAIILIEISNGKVVDIRPVKTTETLEKFLEKSNKNFMVLPNPVKIREDYWIRYKQARSSIERVRLATEFELLTDKRILNISYIVLDIDSPFEEVYPVWQEIVQKIGLTGYVVFKTKSGRFRAYIRVRGEYNDGKKSFKHTIKGIGRNGKTHLENAYEIQYILASFFEKRGLKYDNSFVGRLNHPVWIEEREINGKKSQLYEVKEGEILLYTLYNRLKKLQREEGLWTFNGKNITELLWHNKWKDFEKKEDIKIKIKIKNNLTDKEKLEIALISLLKKHKTNRFKSVMLPVCGWAKYLGLEKDTVYDLLRKYLITKSNFDKDFEKAWKYSSSLEFVWTYKEEELTKKIERYLKVFISEGKEFKMYVKRKDLRELYKTEAEYYEVERYLTDKGYIETGYIKTGKKGRPEKKITLTQEGIKLIERWLNGEKLEDLLNTETNTETSLNTEKDFSQYKTSYSLSLEREQPLGGLVGNGWKENNLLPTQPINQSKNKQKTKSNLYKSKSNKSLKNLYGGGLKGGGVKGSGVKGGSLKDGGGVKGSGVKGGSLKDGGGVKGSGGFTKEARIMALLLGYEREQMARAVVNISKSISYFYQKTYNMEAAIYRTFAVYLYFSEKSGGNKVFLNLEAFSKFEEESLQTEILNVAWKYLERYKEKQKQKQKEQKEKLEQEQKGFWEL